VLQEVDQKHAEDAERRDDDRPHLGMHHVRVRHDADRRIVDSQVADIQPVNVLFTKRALGIRPLPPGELLTRFHTDRIQCVHLHCRIVRNGQVLRAGDLQLSQFLASELHRHLVRLTHHHVVRARRRRPLRHRRRVLISAHLRQPRQRRQDANRLAHRAQDKGPQQTDPAVHQEHHEHI